MEYCGDSISVCGKTDEVKVVRSPKSTVYVTRQNEFEETTVGPCEERIFSPKANMLT